ncbi:hypothetical protein BASA50_010990 [Batrachochytrium salamandrivorans]|uniref:GDP/GTP exchange factor Sec2 N-terminal domain-containing protein n=1 Tax=Batrachochytrium salamandrivorans TaxID=1357716 RepID=A0ABQ8EY04_9FUNG|nr:hypothetical protein BASA50_010990 [Batrachochytrium salamandrivorans]
MSETASTSSSPQSASDDASARLVALKQRLNAVSTKHASALSLSPLSPTNNGSTGDIAILPPNTKGTTTTGTSKATTGSATDVISSAHSWFSRQSDHLQMLDSAVSTEAVKSVATTGTGPTTGPTATTTTTTTASNTLPLTTGVTSNTTTTATSSNTASKSATSSSTTTAGYFTSRIFSNLPSSLSKNSLTGNSAHSSTMSLDSQPISQTNLPDSDPNCLCQSIMSFSDPRRCVKCGGGMKPVIRIVEQKMAAETQSEKSRKLLESANSRQAESTSEMSRLREKSEMLEEMLDHKQYELTQIKRDLETLGEKLIDEIEKRAELQHSKETVQDELEELTKSLFEEANSMVANEARQRHEVQAREQSMAAELGETKIRLQMEQAQLRELRIRMAEVQKEQVRLQVATTTTGYSSNTAGSTSRLQQQSSALGSSLSASSAQDLSGTKGDHAETTKVNKLHSLVFMRNVLEDDVTPCLRFGGNPRTSTKKFIDAIVAHTCFVEQMSLDQMEELKTRDARQTQLAAEKEHAARHPEASADGNSHSGSSHAATEPKHQSQKASTPGQGLFSKTVIERLTHALSSANLPGMSLGDKTLAGPAGCSTCGRDEEYRFHFRISDVSEDTWFPICLNCRDRLVAVCDFYSFVRDMRQGLYTTRPAQDLYMEVLSLKSAMFYARIGVAQVENKHEIFRNIKPVRPNSALAVGLQSYLSSAFPSSALKALDEGSPTLASSVSDTMPLALYQERLHRKGASSAMAEIKEKTETVTSSLADDHTNHIPPDASTEPEKSDPVSAHSGHSVPLEISTTPISPVLIVPVRTSSFPSSPVTASLSQ